MAFSTRKPDPNRPDMSAPSFGDNLQLRGRGVETALETSRPLASSSSVVNFLWDKATPS